MSPNQNTMRDPAPADYDVGYGKPPVQTRFKKGQSGNPSGRPKKQERAPLLDEAKELALKEAARMVTIREGGKVRRMSALQAVYRSQFASAIKGNGPAARAVIKMVQDVEGEYGTKAEAQVDSWMEYKIEAQRRIADCQRRGLPTDDIKPHPDDILDDLEASRVWFRGDIWPDDAAKVRELGLRGPRKEEHASPANDDDCSDLEPSLTPVVLANILEHLAFEPQDAVLHAYNEAAEALTPSSDKAGLNEPSPVSSQLDSENAQRAKQQSKRPKGPRSIKLLDILKRLEPEYHDLLHRALEVEKTAVARLLDGAPRPRPRYAGIPAEDAAGLVRMYSGERLAKMARDQDGPKLSDRIKERSRAILTKRLAQLNALHEIPTLPAAMRAEIGRSLREFACRCDRDSMAPGTKAYVTAPGRMPDP